MRKYIVIALLAGMVATGAVGQDQDQQINTAMRQTELRQKQLDVQQREAKLAFEDKMRQLDLEKRRLEIAAQQKTVPSQMPQQPLWEHLRRLHGIIRGMLAVAVLVHLLLAIWVYQDIRKRNAGSGIWIVLAMLTGPVGTLLYLLDRIGE